LPCWPRWLIGWRSWWGDPGVEKLGFNRLPKFRKTSEVCRKAPGFFDMVLSVIIPTLNEAENILKTIESVRQQDREAEIVVVDGGSVDGTPEITRPHAQVIDSPRGRAAQMNAGARVATGDVLLFLHGDSRLAPGALAQLRITLDNPRSAGGTFTLVFDVDNPLLRFNAFCSNIDWLIFRYGDQGIFVRRSIFEALGGYADIPLMEDIDLLRRLPRYGHRVLIRNYPVTTSARRFVEHGVVRQELLNTALVAAWFAGVKPQALAKWYAARKATT
jgi:rSAM/selenodomain-associated transferase 2